MPRLFRICSAFEAGKEAAGQLLSNSVIRDIARVPE